MQDVRFTLRIVRELNSLLEEEARRKGITKHSLLVHILWDYVTEKKERVDGRNCNEGRESPGKDCPG